MTIVESRSSFGEVLAVCDTAIDLCRAIACGLPQVLDVTSARELADTASLTVEDILEAAEPFLGGPTYEEWVSGEKVLRTRARSSLS